MKKVPFLQLSIEKFPDIPKKELYAAILCGEIMIDGARIKDPKELIEYNSPLSFERKGFVSRGGGKLEYALSEWNIDVKNKVLIDAGSSTGGFTDCLLKRGAVHVHSVDVGYNQLDYTIRSDKRVIVHERTNIMSIKNLDPIPAAAVVDLSFRSIVSAAAHLFSISSLEWIIALIKPQFEWKTPDDSFDGVIRNTDNLFPIVQEVIQDLQLEGVFVTKMLLSPIKGKKGNTEFLFLLCNNKQINITELATDLNRLIQLIK